MILFRFHHSIPEGKSFTGLINAFKFKAEANGEAAIHVFLCPLSEDQQGREMQIELLKSIANDIQNGEVE